MPLDDDGFQYLRCGTQYAQAMRSLMKIVAGIQQKVTTDVVWMPLNNLPVIMYMNNRITGAVPS